MTTVLFGSLTDPSHYGDNASNGGYKAQALWCKLLRQNGVEAYRVTRDGGTVPWLIETPPAISMDTAMAWFNQGRDLRIVTTWIAAWEYLTLVKDQAYFYDQEMAYTTREHFDTLRAWIPRLKLATHNRMTQAWYMTMFGVTPIYIPEWSDTDYWKPDPDKREKYRVGYMNEGPHTAATVEAIRQAVHHAGIPARFVEIAGDEHTVLDQMQRCDVFLGLNLGKHPLWGEGCPRSPQEAMHAGAVVVAFDVLGNREYLIDGYTGVLVPNGYTNIMIMSVLSLLQDNTWREALRKNSQHFAEWVLIPGSRLHLVKEFLDL